MQKQLLASPRSSEEAPGSFFGNSEAALGSSSWPIDIWLNKFFSHQQFLAAPGSRSSSWQLLAALGSSWQHLDIQRQLMATPGSSWWRLKAPGCSCQLLASLGSSWQLLVGPGNSYGFWQLLVIPGSSWQLLVLPGSAWQLLAAPGSSWQLLADLANAETAPGICR